MMKVLLVASVVFLNAYACHSQKGDQIVVSPKAKQAGEVHLTSVPIMAMEYELPERIEDVAIDTLNDCLTILLRGLSNNGKWLENKGHALRYSNVEKRVLWSRKTNYLVEHIESIGGVTLHSKEGECYRLDNQTGEVLWEADPRRSKRRRRQSTE